MDKLAAWNAVCNATSACCLLAGFIAIKGGHRVAHKRLMLGALTASTSFLIGYLTRVFCYGTHKFPDAGLWRTIYLWLLGTHMVLAVVLVPLVVMTVFRAWRGDFAKHRKIAKITWPIWMYVSVTGVIVYWMLYHLAPTL